MGANGQSWPAPTAGESVESGHGGAICCLDSDIIIANSTFSINCTGTAQGGAGGSGGIQSWYAGGNGGGGQSGNGGAIYICSSTVILNDISLQSNSTGYASAGGGGAGGNGGTYGGNVGGDGGTGLSGSGGAIFLDSGAANLINAEHMSNWTGNAQGGPGGHGGAATYAWNGGEGGSGIAGSGGAIFVDSLSQAIICNGLFAGNNTGTGIGANGGEGGAGVSMGNPAYGGDGGDGGDGIGGNGGAISQGRSNLELGNSTMSSNWTGVGMSGYGGQGGPGFLGGPSGSPGNHGQAINGTAIFYAGPSNSSSISNSIFWDNRGTVFSGNLQVAYSCIEGGYPGIGNISLNPIFVPTTLGHYFLSQIAAGQPVQSPGVDAGDPNSGLIPGTTRTDSVMDAGVVDMGYHYLSFIPEPFIATSPQSLHFESTLGSGDPQSQTFHIINPYTGSLNYEIIESANWLQIVPISGGPITPQNPDTAIAYVNVSGLGVGTYATHVEIVAPGSLNGSCTLPVTLILGEAVLSLSTDNLFFSAGLGGPNPPDQSFAINNSGFGILEYSITENAEWLTVSPMSGGPVPPAATVTVTIESDTLPAGGYESDIIVTTPWGVGSPDTIHVALAVGNPSLFVTPDTLMFIDSILQNPPYQNIYVSNVGQGSLGYVVLDTIPWVTVNSTGGVVPPTDQLQVSVDIDSFPVGTYEADIAILAPGIPGSPQRVHIIAEVEPFLSGTIAGVLPSGTYYVTSNLFIAEEDTLIIEPGANLFFQGLYQLGVAGFLQAIGTQDDSIGFAPSVGVPTWKGIELYIGATTLKFCWITGSSYGGLEMHFSNAVISRCKIFGNSNLLGGGLNCSFSSALIDSCLIINNSAVGQYPRGGGVYIASSDPVFRRCAISNNTVSSSATNASGGGICSASSGTRFEHCTIAYNSAVGPGASGGGARCSGDEDSTQFINCAIYSNNSSGVADGLAFYESHGIVQNCIVSVHENEAIGFFDSSAVSVEYGDFYSNGSNFMGTVPPALGVITQTNLNGDSCDAYYNIFLDPLFVNPDSGNFHLMAFSPCVDAGDPNSPPDPDSTIADMGAFYYDHLNNAAPVIISYFPEDLDTVGLGEAVEFGLNAVDPNGDSLLFLWLLNGIPIGFDSTVVIPFDSVGIFQIGAFASDGQAADSTSWTITVMIQGISEKSTIPSTFFLEGNHPNPFNAATTITFGLPVACWVKVEVFDIAGRVVRVRHASPLQNGWMPAGVHQVTFDGSHLASGIYLIRFRAEDFRAVEKMVLLK